MDCLGVPRIPKVLWDLHLFPLSPLHSPHCCLCWHSVVSMPMPWKQMSESSTGSKKGILLTTDGD